MAYTKPTPAEFKAMYPAFAAIGDDTVQLYLTKAERMVDQSWTVGDYPYGIMALAAHYMVTAGLGTGAEAEVNAQGMGSFTTIRSGQLTLQRAATSGSGGNDPYAEFSGSVYGRDFLSMLRRNKPAVAVARAPLAGPPGTPAYDAWPWLGWPR